MNKRASAMAALLLFLVNAFIVRGLFFVDYTREMGSIEAAYISLSRYITENWSDLTWFPLWYGGIPFQNTYPPLLHLTVAAVADALNWSAGRAHHFVTAVAYCLGPVTLFWLALRLSGDRIGSFLSALLYSVLSLSAFLMPIVAHDMGSMLHARRLQALLHYGEGPHVSSMTLLPLAIGCLHLAFERRRPIFYVLTGASFAAVVLTNWLGGFALAAAVASYLLMRNTGFKGWLGTIAIGIYAYALAAPWIPPTTLLTVRQNAQRIGGPFHIGARHLLYAIVFAGVLTAVHRLLIRLGASRIIHFSTLFFLFTGGVTLSAGWFELYLLPQPNRYHLEMEMALVLLIIFALRKWLTSRPLALRAAAVGMFLLFSGNQVLKYRWYAKPMIQPINITQTTEYKIARWFDEHMDGQRVMAPGSISFWMNAFTDTPQIGGGFDQGITNQQLPVAQFQIYSGMDAGHAEGEVALAWLKSLGVHAIAIGGTRSGEYYKPFRNPHKFDGLIPEIWREGDDRIYAVPQRSDSLARIVRAGGIVTRTPETGALVEPLKPYVMSLDNRAMPVALWNWTSRHSATARARLERGQLLSVQIAYHPGWTALVNGIAAPIRSDAIGQMVIEPECTGDCRFDLEFTGGAEAAIARFASYTAVIGGIAWIALSLRKPR